MSRSQPSLLHPIVINGNQTLPDTFPNPFNPEPHPIAVTAASQLKQRLLEPPFAQIFSQNETPNSGKMMGVLLVRDSRGQLSVLHGFSGMLGGQWAQPGFVPPVFDTDHFQVLIDQSVPKIEALGVQLNEPHYAEAIDKANAQLKCVQHAQKLAQVELTRRHLRRKMHRDRLRLKLITLPHSVQLEAEKKYNVASQNDKRERTALLKYYKYKTLKTGGQLEHNMGVLEALKTQRKALSRRLQESIFESTVLTNFNGEQRHLLDLFEGELPPSGTGDCAAPKLLAYAQKMQLQPIALAEFWWGASPSSEVRHHGQFYPSCKGKCGPLMPFQLQGVTELQAPVFFDQAISDTEPLTLYEDAYLAVIVKPIGLLSIPGKTCVDSVQTRLKQRYPDAQGPLLVHRLDMATSGLMLVAKTHAVHTYLQRQFIHRTIEKRYIAVLDKTLDPALGERGDIHLAMRVDLLDRPRQLVDPIHGKSAHTQWQILERGAQHTRIAFTPHTGRTHQLRLHAAHSEGLNAPIRGDRLYGKVADRLYLHAEALKFKHPEDHRWMSFQSPPPF